MADPHQGRNDTFAMEKELLLESAQTHNNIFHKEYCRFLSPDKPLFFCPQGSLHCFT